MPATRMKGVMMNGPATITTYEPPALIALGEFSEGTFGEGGYGLMPSPNLMA